jgi:hypothetical protein
MFDKTSGRVFIIAIVLIILVYYIGATNVLQAGANAAVRLSYALTGRTSSGQFANYPGGGGAPAV